MLKPKVIVSCRDFCQKYTLPFSMHNFMSKKLYDHMCNNTLARRRNVIDKVRVNNAFLFEIINILKAIKSHFEESYD